MPAKAIFKNINARWYPPENHQIHLKDENCYWECTPGPIIYSREFWIAFRCYIHWWSFITCFVSSPPPTPLFRNVTFHTNTFHWPRDLVYDHQGKLQVTARRWNHDVVVEGGREFLFLHLQGQLESTRYNGIKSVAVEEKAD